jgi:hypothetical protein
VRVGRIQRETVGASLLLAGAIIVGAGMAGHAPIGTGLAAGVVLGSLNGLAIQSVLDHRGPILATSVLRLAMLTILALIAAGLLGVSVWPVAIGMGLAQLVMVGVGVRRGMRA